jgi:SAM-dependent methyltransferase
MWQARADAGHRHTDAEWLRFYAAELLLYAPKVVARAVELGCGRGDLFKFMGHAFESYVGVDFSEAMTGAFRAGSPRTMVVRADATHVPLVGGMADFVFCNQLAQYLSLNDLQANVTEAWRILRPGGAYLIANIPDAGLRWAYRSGALRSSCKWSLARAVASVISTELLRHDDGIGLWYHRSGVARLAASVGFAVETFSSSSYEYRFHAVLTKPSADAANGR